MPPNDDYDSPWKDIIDCYFSDFILFFFPEVHPDIDWSRGYESLDAELQKQACRYLAIDLAPPCACSPTRQPCVRATPPHHRLRSAQAP